MCVSLVYQSPGAATANGLLLRRAQTRTAMGLSLYQEVAFYGGTVFFGVAFIVHLLLHLPFAGIGHRPHAGSVLGYILLIFALLTWCAGYTAIGNEQGFWIASNLGINVIRHIMGGLGLLLAGTGFTALATTDAFNTAYYALGAFVSLLFYGVFLVFATISQNPGKFDNGAWAILAAAPLLLFGAILFLSGPRCWWAKLIAFVLALLRTLPWWLLSPAAEDIWGGRADTTIAYLALDVVTALFFLVYH